MASHAPPVFLRELEAQRLDRRVAGAGDRRAQRRRHPARRRRRRRAELHGPVRGRQATGGRPRHRRGPGLLLGGQGRVHGRGVAPAQLADVGCKYVILGHSERRQLFGELDAAVNLKARAALRAGLSPIICVGETLAERDAGETIGRIQAQLDAALADIDDAALERGRDRLRAGLGDRHRPQRDPRPGAGGASLHSHPRRRARSRRSRRACASFTAAA